MMVDLAPFLLLWFLIRAQLCASCAAASSRLHLDVTTAMLVE